nr:MAG TPA: hypothetical protein [Caudoviricetes sp.]
MQDHNRKIYPKLPRHRIFHRGLAEKNQLHNGLTS